MQSSAESPRVIRFGVFEVDLCARELRKNGLKIKLQEQPFQVLCMLLEHPGDVVTREELRHQLWPADTFVDFDHSLNAAIKRLRDALGDSADRPRFIETLPRHGYRLLAPVTASLPSNGAIFDATRRATPSKLLRRITLLLIVPVLLLIALATKRHLWQSVAEIPQWPKERLTANPDEDPVKTAVISPDGKYLSYSDATGAYVKQIATGETHPLILPSGFSGRPVAWYPDSNHLLVQSVEEKPSLWSVSILGGNTRKLAEDAWGAAVSPDGSRIAFIRNAVGVSGICRLSFDCRYALARELWAMASDGAEPQQIVSATAQDRFGPVAWSPDGQRIAYVRLHGGPPVSQFFLETRSLRTGKVAVVLSDPRLDIEAEMMLAWQPIVCWTPDGRLIFGFHEPSPNREDSNVWSVRIDPRTGRPASRPIRLTNGLGCVSSFSVTADGKRLAFIKNTLRPQVYVGEIDTEARVLKNIRRLTLDQRASLPFSWTRDNRSVIFSSDRNGRFEIFKQRIDRPTSELLVSDPAAVVTNARLSPDGSELFYLSFHLDALPSTPVQLMRVPTSGGPPQVVLRAAGIFNQQCARMPAKTCIFSQEEEPGHLTFYSFDPALGTKREIMQVSDQRFLNWSLSPDGALLAMTEEDPHEGRIRLFSFVNASMRDILVRGWSGLSTIDWASNAQSLFVSAIKPDGTIVLLSVNLHGVAHPLLVQKNGAICWSIPSADGKFLAVMVMNGESNAWMIQDF